MRPLFSSTNELDLTARQKYLITSELQMEHAALAMRERILANATLGSKVLIACGSGNNGADGYALARLISNDYDVKILAHEEPKSELAILQARRAKALNIEFCKMPGLADVVVDAIFGSGLLRPLSAKTIGLLQKLNAINGFKLSCDVPSGLFLNGKLDAVVFRADETVTMGAEKLALYNDGAKEFAGKILIANLGVEYAKFCEGFLPYAYVLEHSDMKLPFRNNPNSHKGDFGFVCVIAGEKSGAAILASLASARFGAGLVGLIGANIQPEHIIKLSKIPQNAVIIAGCGLGKISENFLQELKKAKSAVIDADLFYEPKACELLDKEFVLTPHPKEFASFLSLCGFGKFDATSVQENRFELAKKFSLQYPKVTLLLKGANTIIAQNGAMFVMPFGSQILSKGGSGDVLCGIIGALLAQNYKPLDAAITASIAHALSANKFNGANYALTPWDIIDNLATL